MHGRYLLFRTGSDQRVGRILGPVTVYIRRLSEECRRQEVLPLVRVRLETQLRLTRMKSGKLVVETSKLHSSTTVSKRALSNQRGVENG